VLGPGPHGVRAEFTPYAFDVFGRWSILDIDDFDGMENHIVGAETRGRWIVDDGAWAPLFESVRRPPAVYARRPAERPWSSNAA
jgi:hypothetical protein